MGRISLQQAKAIHKQNPTGMHGICIKKSTTIQMTFKEKFKVHNAMFTVRGGQCHIFFNNILFQNRKKAFRMRCLVVNFLRKYTQCGRILQLHEVDF